MDREAWVHAVDVAVRAAPGPVVLVGHSCGAVAVAQWAAAGDVGQAVAALLVAPADVEAPTAPEPTRGQAPLPTGPLPLRTHVVAGEDDPYLGLARARRLAAGWGSTIETLPDAGHIATADGFGPWPRAAQLLEMLSGQPLTPRCGEVPPRGHGRRRSSER